MIHELGVELQKRLRAQGCPVPVLDTESTKTTTYARERIVLERSGPESFSEAKSQRANAKHRVVRGVRAKLTIYAFDPRQGAMRFEHEERADRILDLVVVAISEYLQENKLASDAWVPDGGDWSTPEDLAATERPGGAAYILEFTVPRAQRSVTWTNAAAPEVAMGGVGGPTFSSTTKVSLVGATGTDDPTNPPAGAATGCGS